MLLRFVVPFPESIRSRKKTGQAVTQQLDSACRNAYVGPQWEGTVRMTFFGHWRHKNGKRKRRDAHNYAMVLIDLLQSRLVFDDSQVIDFHIHKRPASGNREYVSVEIT